MSRVERQDNVGHMEILTSLRNNQAASGFYREPDGVMLMSSVALPMGNWKLIIAQDAVTLFQPILVTVVLGLYFLVFFLLNRQMQGIDASPGTNPDHRGIPARRERQYPDIFDQKIPGLRHIP